MKTDNPYHERWKAIREKAALDWQKNPLEKKPVKNLDQWIGKYPDMMSSEEMIRIKHEQADAE